MAAHLCDYRHDRSILQRLRVDCPGLSEYSFAAGARADAVGTAVCGGAARDIGVVHRLHNPGGRSFSAGTIDAKVRPIRIRENWWRAMMGSARGALLSSRCQ